MQQVLYGYLKYSTFSFTSWVTILNVNLIRFSFQKDIVLVILRCNRKQTFIIKLLIGHQLGNVSITFISLNLLLFDIIKIDLKKDDLRR